MSTEQRDTGPPGPLELIESARAKYTLAMARVRRGPPELGLLSLHGSLEDALRAHGLRLRLPAAQQPLPQLLEALVLADQAPLSPAEADGIKRMHRLRARVAHGEQIAVARETIDAYHRLVARLLPRYGIVVVGPEEQPEAATGTTVPARRGETAAALRRDTPETRRRGDTQALERNLEPPRRERTVYPDNSPARYGGRALPSAATRDLPVAREMFDGRAGQRAPGRAAALAAFWGRWQAWLLPALIVISIFLVGLVISLSLQQLRAGPVAPTAAVSAPTPAPPPPTAPPASSTGGEAGPAPTVDSALAATAGPAPAATAGAPGELAVGKTAYVRAEAGALNVRAQPGTAPNNPVQVILDPGTAVEISGGPISADGYTWWQVRAAGAEGWCAGQWLELR